MDILITGTDGCIGSSLKQYFRSKGFSVTGTVFFKSPEEGEYRVDVQSPESIAALPEKNFPIVIHTAGIVDQDAPAKLIRGVNAGGTANMLGWAKSHGCGHFIQMSSISVYGMKTMGINRTEANTRRYNGPFAIPYMRSKAEAERLIEGSGVPYTLLRLPAVLGRNDASLSSSIIRPLLDGTFCFSGSGEKPVSLICVKNLGPLIHAVIDAGPQNDFFHCVDHDVPWREFVAEYAKLLGVALPERKKSIASIVTHFGDKMFLLMVTFSFFGAHFSNEKLRSAIRFETPFSWQECVKDAVEGFRESGGGLSCAGQ